MDFNKANNNLINGIARKINIFNDSRMIFVTEVREIYNTKRTFKFQNSIPNNILEEDYYNGLFNLIMINIAKARMDGIKVDFIIANKSVFSATLFLSTLFHGRRESLNKICDQHLAKMFDCDILSSDLLKTNKVIKSPNNGTMKINEMFFGYSKNIVNTLHKIILCDQ